MCDLLEAVGPDAATMCEGWTTRHLLAHLLLRERRPDAAGGIAIPALAKRAQNVMDAIAKKPYADMIEQFRGGPPIWSPWALPVLGDKGNLVEFFVHHEDIRRAQPGWDSRENGPLDDALWKTLNLMGRLVYRRSPGGVVLRSANRPDIVAKKGTPEIVVVGEPGEIVLHAFGRQPDKVRVVVQGAAADVEKFDAVPRGL